MTVDPSATPKARRRCAACGGELKFSHREYAGRGTSAAVLRCTGCGEVTRDAAREAPQAAQRHRSKHHRDLEEGPPANPVLDPITAARLLESTRDST
jgi:uncharacterized protein with PIN domain